MASTAERKTVILPLVATCPGLGPETEPWVELWIAARERLGLKFVDEPTMPSMNNDGSWGPEPMTSTEGTALLVEILETFGPAISSGRKLVSHSLKSTGLSWASKRPLQKDYRRALGHHLDANDVSVGVYSRDYLYAALVAFDGMLMEICKVVFRPDDTRSARAVRMREQATERHGWRREGDTVNGASFAWAAEDKKHNPDCHPTVVSKGNTDNDKSESNSSSSSGSDSSESDSEVSIPDAVDEEALLGTLGAEQPCVKRDYFTDASGASIEMFQHIKSGVLHARRNDTHLCCGRTISRAFNKVKSELIVSWPKCDTCDKLCPNPKFIQPVPKRKPQPQAS